MITSDNIVMEQGLVTDMLLNKSHGGKGKSRLPKEIEQIIREVLRSHYLNKQKLSESAIWNEIVHRCRKFNVSAPSLNTVRLRIQWLTYHLNLTYYF